MRGTIACALAATAALLAAPAALASSLSVTAPATANEGSTIPVHVTGTADEFELAWTAFVQNEACPATLVEAQNQPGATKQNKTQLQKGPFEFDSMLSPTGGRPPFPPLHGTVNVCSYLYHEFTSDQSTVATAVNSVNLIGQATSPFKFLGHMSSTGTIRVTVPCRHGCKLKVDYTSAVSGKQRTVTKHLPARAKPGSIELQLDKKTISLVRKIRKKRIGGPVKVDVDATATPPSGAPLHATRTVKVT